MAEKRNPSPPSPVGEKRDISPASPVDENPNPPPPAAGKRGVSPVIGVVLLVGLTITLSASVFVVVDTGGSEPPPTATFAVSANATADRIAVTHRAGDELDVTDLRIVVRVDGQRLRHQPPVPFFAADGFESGPEGVFNSASPNRFSAGGTGSFRVADTNHPQVTPGTDVTVTIGTEKHTLYEETVTATG